MDLVTYSVAKLEAVIPSIKILPWLALCRWNLMVFVLLVSEMAKLSRETFAKLEVSPLASLVAIVRRLEKHQHLQRYPEDLQSCIASIISLFSSPSFQIYEKAGIPH